VRGGGGKVEAMGGNLHLSDASRAWVKLFSVEFSEKYGAFSSDIYGTSQNRDISI